MTTPGTDHSAEQSADKGDKGAAATSTEREVLLVAHTGVH